MASLTLEDAKRLFAEQFQEQLKSFMDIIAGNREIFAAEIKTLKNEIVNLKKLLTADIALIKEEVKTVKKDVDDLKLSVEHVDEVNCKKMKKIESDFKSKIEETNTSLEKKIQEIQNKQNEIEDRARRNNIRVDGLAEEDGETWEDSKNKVSTFVKEKMGLDIDIQRAHRVGRSDDENDRPRTIVAYLLKYTDKERLLRNGKVLKGTGVYINEDYCKETMLKRKKLRDEAKDLAKRHIKTKLVYPFDRLIYLNDNVRR